MKCLVASAILTACTTLPETSPPEVRAVLANDVDVVVVGSALPSESLSQLVTGMGLGLQSGPTLHLATLPDSCGTVGEPIVPSGSLCTGGAGFARSTIGPDGIRDRVLESGLGEVLRCMEEDSGETCAVPRGFQVASLFARQEGAKEGSLFWRPHVPLAVVFHASYDDCSIDAPADSAVACAAETLTCSEPLTEPGEKSGCSVRPTAIADELRGQIADHRVGPEDVLLYAVANAAPLQVNADGTIAESCTGYRPAPRTASLVRAFDPCAQGSSVFETVGQAMQLDLDALGCVSGALPLMPSCDVEDIRSVADGTTRRVPVAPCGVTGSRPCWEMASAPECPHRARLVVQRQTPAPDTTTVARCEGTSAL